MPSFWVYKKIHNCYIFLWIACIIIIRHTTFVSSNAFGLQLNSQIMVMLGLLLNICLNLPMCLCQRLLFSIKICHFIFFYVYLSYKTKITFYNNIFPVYFTSFSSLHSLLLVSFISFVDTLCHICYTAYTFFPFCFLF